MVAGWFAGLISNTELNQFFSADRKKGRFSMTAFEPHPITGQPIALPVERTGAAPRPATQRRIVNET
jgi:hypothetical protein